MPAPNIKSRAALSSVLFEIIYSLCRLLANPLTALLAAQFQARRDEWKLVNDEEITNEEASSFAQARIDAANDAIDAFCSKLSKIILIITKDDRTHSLYVHFFGQKTLSRFVRPKLGEQLKSMRTWSDSLKKSPSPELKALVPELDALITAADEAIAARDTAAHESKVFRDLGARKAFIDRVNVTRKTTHGELAKLAIQTPGLPADFAEQFFHKVPPEEEATIESVSTKITTLGEELEEQKELLAELQKEADEEAKLEAEKKEAEAELEELDKKDGENDRRRAELRKLLHKK